MEIGNSNKRSVFSGSVEQFPSLYAVVVMVDGRRRQSKRDEHVRAAYRPVEPHVDDGQIFGFSIRR